MNCPHCNHDKCYVGAFVVECENPKCAKYKPKTWDIYVQDKGTVFPRIVPIDKYNGWEALGALMQVAKENLIAGHPRSADGIRPKCAHNGCCDAMEFVHEKKMQHFYGYCAHHSREHTPAIDTLSGTLTNCSGLPTPHCKTNDCTEPVVVMRQIDDKQSFYLS